MAPRGLAFPCRSRAIWLWAADIRGSAKQAPQASQPGRVGRVTVLTPHAVPLAPGWKGVGPHPRSRGRTLSPSRVTLPRGRALPAPRPGPMTPVTLRLAREVPAPRPQQLGPS